MVTLTADVISPIGRRLLYSLFVIGSVVTLLATATVLFMDYRAGIRHYEDALQQIRSSYQASITYSLWNFDKRQLETQLQGILNFPGVTHVQLDHDDKVLHSLGDLYQKPDRRLNIPLAHESAGLTHPLGTLRISQNYQALYDDLLGQAVEIFVTQLLLVVAFAVMILVIVHRLITYRLSRMSAWASRFSLENPQLELRVDRPGDERDELSQVADAINQMRVTLLADLQLRETEHLQLEQLQEQLALAVDNAALGFCRFNIREDTFSCNSHFASQLGVGELELENLKQPMEFFLSRFTGPEAAQQTERIRQLLRGHQVRLHDSFRVLDKQDQQRFFDISLQVISYDENRPEQVLICMIDRSKELRAREQLNILRLRLDQEVDIRTQELQTQTAALEQERTQLQRELQRLKSARQPDHMHSICSLLAADLQQWQSVLPAGSMHLWQHFFSLDLYRNRRSLDICQYVRQWLQQQEQQHNFELELHLPFSLISDENPDVLIFILQHLLFSPDCQPDPHSALNLTLRVGDTQLEAEMILSGSGWPDHADNQAFRLCQALIGLRYDGTLTCRQEEQQQVLLLSMPFIQ